MFDVNLLDSFCVSHGKLIFEYCRFLYYFMKGFSFYVLRKGSKMWIS